MKNIILIISVLLLIAVAATLWAQFNGSQTTDKNLTNEQTMNTEDNSVSQDNTVVTDGTYTVIEEQSSVRWAGKKPLLDGYVNSGSIAVDSGVISVSDNTATGTFTIDMTTLSVSETPTKPGKESALEGHLQGSGWFDVETYPTAQFEIVEVTEQPNSAQTFVYDVRGNLTMKGQTHEITFPATIYLDSEGLLHAQADTEFDRTVWGITAGSGSFFDNLADNVVADEVALSFELVAQQQ
jgi:polyisoprenoid-binding protein YceI